MTAPEPPGPAPVRGERSAPARRNTAEHRSAMLRRFGLLYWLSLLGPILGRHHRNDGVEFPEFLLQTNALEVERIEPGLGSLHGFELGRPLIDLRCALAYLLSG